MAFEPQRIAVVIEHLSFKDIWTLQQEVTIDGSHVKDGSYTTTIEIPLEKPKKKISVHLKIREDELTIFMKGYLYTGNDGLSYVAKDEKHLISADGLIDVEQYFSPTYVIHTGTCVMESSTKPLTNE
jgi:ribosomal protein S4E